MSHINVSYADIEQAAARLGAWPRRDQRKAAGFAGLIQNLVSSGFVTEHASVQARRSVLSTRPARTTWLQSSPRFRVSCCSLRARFASSTLESPRASTESHPR